MKINYRVLSYNEKDHSMLVRYWTDILSEDDLALIFDEYDKIVYNANGYPVRTRTDVNITFYDNTNPSDEDIINKIKASGPISWLELLEQNKLSNTQYSLANVASFVGISNSFNVVMSSNGSIATQIITSKTLKEDAAKIAIRYIQTGVYDLGNTDTYVI
jgi:hypothetical protein